MTGPLDSSQVGFPLLSSVRNKHINMGEARKFLWFFAVHQIEDINKIYYIYDICKIQTSFLLQHMKRLRETNYEASKIYIEISKYDYNKYEKYYKIIDSYVGSFKWLKIL